MLFFEFNFLIKQAALRPLFQYILIIDAIPFLHLCLYRKTYHKNLYRVHFIYHLPAHRKLNIPRIYRFLMISRVIEINLL